MNKLPTKDKGDIGLTKIIADLTEKQVKVCLPIPEHLPFDLIAVSPVMKLAKLSVKYASLNKEGKMEIPLRTVSYNSKGCNMKRVNQEFIDGFAVYCPDTKKCYYINKIRYKNLVCAFILEPNEDLSDPSVFF